VSGVATLLPGCIVQDIRQQLTTANTQLYAANVAIGDTSRRLDDTKVLLEAANARLDAANTRLDATNARVDAANARIDDTITRLDQTQPRLDAANARLTGLEPHLSSLAPSLRSVDVHLASLRGSLAAIDELLPFGGLGLGSGPSPTVAAAAPQTGAPGDAGASAGDGAAPAAPGGAPTGVPSTPAVPARRDPLLGVWISVYPDDRVALLLAADGRYAQSTIEPSDERASANPDGQVAAVRTSAPAIERGTWSRAEAMLMFTPTSTPAAADPKAASQASATVPRSFRVAASSFQSLVLETDEGLRVFARP
jgi:hypothetical protein